MFSGIGCTKEDMSLEEGSGCVLCVRGYARHYIHTRGKEGGGGIWEVVDVLYYIHNPESVINCRVLTSRIDDYLTAWNEP